MSTVAKVIEITAESPKSFEHAVRLGVKRAGKTVKKIRGVWIKDQEAVVKGGEVVAFRVSMKITFIIG